MRKMLFFFIIVFGFFSQAYALTVSGDVAPVGAPDGEISIGDAVVAARMALGLITPDLDADVAPLGSPDGEITIGDAVVLARAALGLVALPVLSSPSGAFSDYDAAKDYISKRYQQTIDNAVATLPAPTTLTTEPAPQTGVSVPATSTAVSASSTTTAPEPVVPIDYATAVTPVPTALTTEPAPQADTSVPATSTAVSSSSTTTAPEPVVPTVSPVIQTESPSKKPHFTDNNDGTFTDNVTGLHWLKKVGCLDESTWDNAAAAAAGVTYKGGLSCGAGGNTLPQKPWRLPTLAELETLVDGKSCPSVSTDNPAYEDVGCGCYWSGTEASLYRYSVVVTGGSRGIPFTIPRVWGVCFNNGVSRELLTESRRESVIHLGTGMNNVVENAMKEKPKPKYRVWPVYGEMIWGATGLTVPASTTSTTESASQTGTSAPATSTAVSVSSSTTTSLEPAASSTLSQTSPTPSASTSTPASSNVTVPSSFSTQPKIATGYAHTVVLRRDGTVWTWGDNTYGQVGDGTGSNLGGSTIIFGSIEVNGRTHRASPFNVGLTGVIDIAAGAHHTVALKSDGSVWTWGRNDYRQLGRSSQHKDYYYQTKDGWVRSGLSNWVNRYYSSSVIDADYGPIPRQVDGLTGVVAVAAGYRHTVVLKNDGTAWGWGYNDHGQLGNLTSGSLNPPVISLPSRIDELSGISAIAAGDSHTLASCCGVVWAFGDNSKYQLGRDRSVVGNQVKGESTPVQIPGLTGVTTIAASGSVTVALKNDGTVWRSWVDTSLGKFYDLIPGLAGATAVDVGLRDTVGLTLVGGVEDYIVALKNGTVWESSTSGTKQVHATYLSGVSAISVGDKYVVAMKNDDTIWAWGVNDVGQLGDGTFTDSALPVQSTFSSGISEIK